MNSIKPLGFTHSGGSGDRETAKVVIFRYSATQSQESFFVLSEVGWRDVGVPANNFRGRIPKSMSHLTQIVGQQLGIDKV